MKKYFTKYLPVEGLIQHGDWVYYDEDQSFFKYENCDELPDLNFMNSVGSYEKAKPFLCSRDIQVGDKVRGDANTLPLEQTEWIIADKHFFELQNMNELLPCFKVIGEISPEATWVKEGDEFDEREVHVVGLYPYTEKEKAEVWDTSRREYARREDEEYGWYHRRKYVFGNNIPKTDKYMVYIKGPCGHFH